MNQVDSVGFLPLVSLMVFIAAFSLGFGPVPWILNVELIPPEARVSVTVLHYTVFIFLSSRQSPPPSAQCSTGWFRSWLLCWSPSLVTTSAQLPATSYSLASLSSAPSSSSSSYRRPRGKLKTKLENIFPRNIKVWRVVYFNELFIIYTSCCKTLIKLDYILDRSSSVITLHQIFNTRNLTKIIICSVNRPLSRAVNQNVLY